MLDTYTCPLCATKSDQWSERGQINGIGTSFECECGSLHMVHDDRSLTTTSRRTRDRANRAVAAMNVRDEFDGDGPAET